jgi:hypothetical protein
MDYLKKALWAIMDAITSGLLYIIEFLAEIPFANKYLGVIIATTILVLMLLMIVLLIFFLIRRCYVYFSLLFIWICGIVAYYYALANTLAHK